MEALIEILHEDESEGEQYTEDSRKVRDKALLSIFSKVEESEDNAYADKSKENFKKLQQMPEAFDAL